MSRISVILTNLLEMNSRYELSSRIRNQIDNRLERDFLQGQVVLSYESESSKLLKSLGGEDDPLLQKIKGIVGDQDDDIIYVTNSNLLIEYILQTFRKSKYNFTILRNYMEWVVKIFLNHGSRELKYSMDRIANNLEIYDKFARKRQIRIRHIDQINSAKELVDVLKRVDDVNKHVN